MITGLVLQHLTLKLNASAMWDILGVNVKLRAMAFAPAEGEFSRSAAIQMSKELSSMVAHQAEAVITLQRDRIIPTVVSALSKKSYRRPATASVELVVTAK